MKQKRCAELHYSLSQSSNTLNYWRIELASLYTVPLSAVNGLSCLTKLTTSKEQARRIRFENVRIVRSSSNRIGRPIRIRVESRSFAGP